MLEGQKLPKLALPNDERLARVQGALAMTLFLLALALSMDAFAVAVGQGAAARHPTVREAIRVGLALPATARLDGSSLVRNLMETHKKLWHPFSRPRHD